MIQSFIHTSESSNLYIYDDQHRLSMLVHPNFESAKDNLGNVDPYYVKKYAYLRDHGFFEKPKPTNFRTLEESVVRDNIINAKQIVFEVTDSCNLNCAYCSLGELYEGVDERIGKNINTDYAIKLLKYVFNHKPKNKISKLIISFYGGEALLNIRFIKRIVEVSRELNVEKGIELEYSMTTNATMLHKCIDFLVENKFFLLISLDGGEDNHSYRVFASDKKNSFHRVIKNVDMIQKKYPEYFDKNVEFNAVLHDRNSVKEINEFIYMRYHKYPRISELSMRDMKSDKIDMLDKMFRDKMKSEIEFQKEESDLFNMMRVRSIARGELTDFLKYFSINYYISNMNDLLHISEKQLPTCTCTPFSRKIFLTNRNKLLVCEKVNYKYSMGFVEKEIKIDIPEITKKYNVYFEYLKKFCQNCYAYRFCGKCLFHIKDIDRMNFEENPCDQFKDQDGFKNKMYQIVSYLEKYPGDFSQILEDLIIE